MSDKLGDRDYLLADAVMRLSAIQRLLVKKNILQDKEISDELELMSSDIMSIVEKMNNKSS